MYTLGTRLSGDLNKSCNRNRNVSIPRVIDTTIHTKFPNPRPENPKLKTQPPQTSVRNYVKIGKSDSWNNIIAIISLCFDVEWSKINQSRRRLQDL